MGLEFISNVSSSNSSSDIQAIMYRYRVEKDGGEVADIESLKSFLQFVQDNNIPTDKLFSATSANWGIKKNGSYLQKLYSPFSEQGDIVLTKGTFTLATQENKQAIFCSGSATNQLASVGSIESNNLSLFNSFKKGASTTQAITTLSEFWKTDVDYRGLNTMYSAATNLYTAYAYTPSGIIESIAAGKGFSSSVNSARLKAYRDGLVVGEDTQLAVPTLAPYRLYIASGATSSGSQGYYFANIAAHDLTDAQELLLASYVSNFV